MHVGVFGSGISKVQIIYRSGKENVFAVAFLTTPLSPHHPTQKYLLMSWLFRPETFPPLGIWVSPWDSGRPSGIWAYLGDLGFPG